MSTGPSKLWVEAMTWAGAQGAHHTKPGLWTGNAGEMDGVSIDVAANTNPEEVDGVPGYGIRLTSKTHLMACIFTPAGGVLGGGAPGDEDRLIAFFERLNLAGGRS